MIVLNTERTDKGIVCLFAHFDEQRVARRSMIRK